MRISTGMIYDTNVRSLQARTSSLLHTQQQLASGRRILTPSDDPAAAARALEVNQALSINNQYAVTQGYAKDSLSLAESQLSSANDLLNTMRDLAVQGGNAALNASDRQSIAKELRSHFDTLVGLANSTDGSGQYLFSGYQGSNMPFAGSVENGVTYSGDDGQREMRISSSRQIAVSASGSDVFMNVQNGNGVFTAGVKTERSLNATTLAVEAKTVSNPPANSGNVELRFWVDAANALGGGAGATYYDLVDPSSGNSLFSGATSDPVTGSGQAGYVGHTYSSGVPITLNNGVPAFDYGATLAISGAPQTGDTYVLSRTATNLTASPKTPFPSAARATIDSGVVTDKVLWTNTANSGNLELRFWVDTADTLGGGSGKTYYDLVDAKTGFSEYTGATSTPGGAGYAGHEYTSGASIALGNGSVSFGASLTVSGVPATGDAFTIKNSNDLLGNGTFVTSPKMGASSNLGSGIIGTGTVLDAAKWNSTANSGKLEIRFWNNASTTPAGLFYDIVDTLTQKSLFTDTASTQGGGSNTFTRQFNSGDVISLNGLAPAYGDFGASVAINGTPADGDIFTLNNSQSESVFSTFGRLITALEAPTVAGSSGNTALHNTLASVLTNLNHINDNILRVRTDMGTRLNEIETLGNVVAANKLEYTATLSSLQDVDYTTAIMELTQNQTGLDAAQKSFMKISALSLFNYV